MNKTLFKIVLLILSSLLIIYFILVYIEGGFGKKPAIILPVKNTDSLFLFAHRGISADFPENSREAIEQAKIMKFKGLEIDIRKTADNQFILFHDENCRRLIGLDEDIFNMTMAQLREHPLIFNNVKTGSHVLTLNEMLDEYKDDFIFYFDMKLKGINDVDELVFLIETYDISRSTIIASTSALLIFYIESNYPAINTALEGFNAGKEWTWQLIPKNLKPDYLSGFASKIDQAHIDWLQKEDLLSQRFVYGIDSTNYQSMVGLGLKNMIIDYWPGLR